MSVTGTGGVGIVIKSNSSTGTGTRNYQRAAALRACVRRASASSATCVHSCFSPGAEAGAGLANGIAAVTIA